jgi:hypothetical protein
MNLSGNISLVTLGTMVFFAGIIWNELRRMRGDIKQVRDDMKESAKAQGERLGELKDDVGTLKDWKARQEAFELGRRRERADTRGIPISTEE